MFQELIISCTNYQLLINMSNNQQELRHQHYMLVTAVFHSVQGNKKRLVELDLIFPQIMMMGGAWFSRTKNVSEFSPQDLTTAIPFSVAIWFFCLIEWFLSIGLLNKGHKDQPQLLKVYLSEQGNHHVPTDADNFLYPYLQHQNIHVHVLVTGI